MLTVGTYFWNPDPGSKFAAGYTPDDVRRLQRQTARHLKVPHQFVVITDVPHAFDGDKDIRAVPIDWTKHVPGTCFVRLMTFHPNGRELIGDAFLQLDLDTLIVGDIEPVVSRTENLVMWRNPARVPWDGEQERGSAGATVRWNGERTVYVKNHRRCFYNASIILHRCGTRPDIWHGFDPKSPPAKDDQWYLSDLLGKDCPYFDQSHGVYRLARDDTPGSGVSGALPDNARIVTFPGSNGKWTLPHIAAANPWIERALA